MRAIRVHRGMPMRSALRAAELLGCSVESGHRGGELRLRHWLVETAVVTHETRKTATIEVVTWLLSIAARAEALRAAFGFSRAA